MDSNLLFVFILNTLFSISWILVVYRFLRDKQIAFPGLLLIPCLFWDLIYFLQEFNREMPSVILANYVLWIIIDLYLLRLLFKKGLLPWRSCLIPLAVSLIVTILVTNSASSKYLILNIGTLLFLLISIGSTIHLHRFGIPGQSFVGFLARFIDTIMGLVALKQSEYQDNFLVMNLCYLVLIADFIYFLYFLFKIWQSKKIRIATNSN